MDAARAQWVAASRRPPSVPRLRGARGRGITAHHPFAPRHPAVRIRAHRATLRGCCRSFATRLVLKTARAAVQGHRPLPRGNCGLASGAIVAASADACARRASPRGFVRIMTVPRTPASGSTDTLDYGPVPPRGRRTTSSAARAGRVPPQDQRAPAAWCSHSAPSIAPGPSSPRTYTGPQRRRRVSPSAAQNGASQR